MKYFIACELGIANVLQRYFCWTSNSLWVEEIPNVLDPNKTMFLLNGKDKIVRSDVSPYSLGHSPNTQLSL